MPKPPMKVEAEEVAVAEQQAIGRERAAEPLSTRMSAGRVSLSDGRQQHDADQRRDR